MDHFLQLRVIESNFLQCFIYIFVIVTTILVDGTFRRKPGESYVLVSE